MKRFADTHFFLALVNPTDSMHAQARQYSQDQQGTLVTSEWVLLEVADGLASHRHRHVFDRLNQQLYNFPQSIIVEADHSTFELARQLFSARPDKDWSLTDCTSFIIMRRYNITEALTGDHHFEQAGFVPLLK
jgi:uncharacterized protein